MLTFQCKDGGWAAFDRDCTKGVLEKVPFADHNAMLDPECADITARILELSVTKATVFSIRKCRGLCATFRSAGRGWLLVRPLGRELYLWHLAGPARFARLEPRYEPTLASQGKGLAGKCSTRGRRLG
jgi:hypothetical protein